MRYQLRVKNTLEHTVETIDIEAPDEDTAIHLCCVRAIEVDSVVELWRADHFIIRMTPMAARLHGFDADQSAHLGRQGATLTGFAKGKRGAALDATAPLTRTTLPR